MLLYARRNPGFFYVRFQKVVTHGKPDQGHYSGEAPYVILTKGKLIGTVVNRCADQRPA